MDKLEGSFTNAIEQIQKATEELKEDNDKVMMKYKQRLEREAWQQGLQDEYERQMELQSMKGSY